MRRYPSGRLVCGVVLAVAGASAVAQATVLYSSLPAVPSSGTESTFTANDAAVGAATPADLSNNTNGQGIATFYSTGFTSITLSDLKFYGGLPQTTASQTNGANGDVLELQFYTAAGAKVGFPNGSLTNISTATGPDGLYTIATNQPSFLGGAAITVPGSGYVALIPTNNAPGEPTGTPTPYPVNQPTEDLYYTSSTPSVGTGNGVLFPTTGYNTATGGSALLTVAGTPPGGVTPPAYLEIQLDGTGTGAVPEPVSLSLIAPAAMLLARRRRAR